MEEKLIVAVKVHSELYNPADYSYRDRNKKDLAWRRVSEDVGVSVEACRKRWKSLRDKYAREGRKDKRKPCGAEAAQPWKFLADMSFLEPFITPRESSGNMERRVKEEQAAWDHHPKEEPEEAEEAAGLSGAEDTTSQGSDTSLPELPAAASSSSSVMADTSPASAPTGPQRERAWQRPLSTEPTEWEREMLAALRAKTTAAPPQSYSVDHHFMLSLLPLLEKVPPQSKDFVKFQIHKLLYESTVLPKLEPLDSTE